MHHLKGVTAYTQIPKCIMKFYKIGQLSTCTCVFEAAEIITGQDFNSNYKQPQLHEISLGYILILALNAYKT